MSVCADMEMGKLENDENVAANDCNNVRWRNDDKDCSGSQEMFSDDDQLKDAVSFTPKNVVKNETLNSSIISLKTPILCSKVSEITPRRAGVPRTPADLLPFIRKTSILWTSDMETPESKLNEKTENQDRTIESEKSINNTTPTRKQSTPNFNDMKTDKADITSPVLGGKKRSKRRVKRRILNNVALDLDNNNDQQSSISSNSDRVPSAASSVCNEIVRDIEPEISISESKKCQTSPSQESKICNGSSTEEPKKCNGSPTQESKKCNASSSNEESKICNKLTSEECKENKKLEDLVVDKNSNTSTQDFFCNASFSSLDRLCSSIIQEDKQNLVTIKEEIQDDSQNIQNGIVIKQEVNNEEESKVANVDNDVLERVAAIRRNKKPLRRSTSISQTVIPKEAFSKSLMELQLADAAFNREIKKAPNTQHKPLNLISFAKLSSIENDINIKKVNTTEKENEINQFTHDVPAELMDDWNTNDFLINEPGKENFKNLPNTVDSPKAVNGKGIIFKENEENGISSSVISSSNSVKVSVNQLHSYNNLLTIKDDLVSKDDHFENNSASTNGFSTASGKNIAISEDKILDYAKVYNEIENENLNENIFLELKKGHKSKKLQNNLGTNIIPKQILAEKTETSDKKSEILKLYQELDLEEFLEPKFTSDIKQDISDGFSTAGGKSIKINNEKESFYSKIYKDLENSDENGLLNIKKSKISKLNSNEKPKDKAVIIFNKKESTLISEVPASTSKLKLEIPSAATTSDGFSTAGGNDIKINNEKESYYAKIYNELSDSDENSLLNIKKNKISRTSFNEKSKNTPLIVFNEKKTILENKIPTLTVKPKLETISNLEATSDSFSTAGGKGIKISEEKEKHYLKIFDNLSEDICDENCFLNMNINKNNLSKINNNNKLVVKPLVVFNKKKTETAKAVAKLSISSDTDEAFYDLGDIEKLLTPPNQDETLKNIEIESNNCFTVPNSTHALKKVNQTSTITQNVQSSSLTSKAEEITVKEENVCTNRKLINGDAKILQGKLLEKESIFKTKPDKSHMGILKRKLDGCEVKRPERCRSFGGFPVSNESVSATKLNKSDPNDETYMNQPLQNGLSVSQCFDSHSDSWLSKVELSYLNHSKGKSPELKEKQSESKAEETDMKTKESFTVLSDLRSGKSDEILGFSFKDCTESFRRYANFKKILRKQKMEYNSGKDLNIEIGHTISISNRTLSKQQLFVQFENNVDMTKSKSNQDYILIESKSKKITFNLPESCELKKAIEGPTKVKVNGKMVQKRKHADTDSDTPLTTSKKPRVGSDLQGRKLFSDESDVEESGGHEVDNGKSKTESENPLPAPKSQEVCTQLVKEVDLSEERFSAVLQQEKIIRNKKRIKVKPTIGSLLRQRLVNSKTRPSWIEFVGSAVPTPRSIEKIREIHPDAKILEVTASNATCYKFLSSNIVGNKKTVSLDVGDDALLIFDENGHAGVSEFTEAFLAMPGVDPKLIPTGWIENHYKWIIWKLASIDRIDFRYTQYPKVLTPERVMKELKYRYDREIDRAQRPALRRILEKDDVSSRRIVLCISSIKENARDEDMSKEVRAMLGQSRWKIEATDGWYSIPLTIDNAMANYILNGKIKEGTKIITYGAELLECERGFFPLEKPANVSLKIHTNSTRRARWDTKLGYQKNSGPIPVKLRNIVPGGGLVGETTAVATRVYPLLYREKTADGQSIYRNARSEEKTAIAHERALELKVDAMYAKAQKNLDSKKKLDSDEDVENSQSPLEGRTRTQKHREESNHWEKRQEEFKQRLESEVRQGLPPPRNVTPVLKVRLVADRTSVILTIWGASEDSEYDIREGNTVTVYNAYVMGTRGGELNLTANRITHIKTEPLLKLPYPVRTCTLVPDLAVPSFEPKFCEFDTVGIVVSSGPAPHGMKNFEIVNVAYPNPNSTGSSYLSILFWNGMSSFGYQGMFTAGSFIACSNLEWRRNTSWSIAVAYCSEKTIFTSNPRQQHLSKELRNLKALVQNPVAYAESCVEEVASELSKKPQPRSSQSTPRGWSDRSSFYQSPIEGHSPGGAAIQRRLEMLSRYSAGSSNDVSPMVLNNSSARVNRDYTPVTRNNT